jgi:hypothetical protein
MDSFVGVVNVSEEPPAYIFRVEITLKTDAAGSSDTSVTIENS